MTSAHRVLASIDRHVLRFVCVKFINILPRFSIVLPFESRVFIMKPNKGKRTLMFTVVSFNFNTEFIAR